MIVNLKDILSKIPEGESVNEYHLVYTSDNGKIVFEGKHAIPWSDMHNLEYDDDDTSATPVWSGWVSYTDNSWVELVVVEVMGRYYFEWVYRKCPTLS